MVNRIETIDDLIIWLGSIINLKTKNVNFDVGLTIDQISDFAGVQDTLSKIKSKLSDPFKQCIKCDAIYPATKEWFDWNGRGRDGLNSICKFCRNAYQKKRKSKGRKSPYSSADQAELEAFGQGAGY